jgi:HNH endonuclease
MHEDQLWEVFQKTGGYCHYCGDRLQFRNRGWSAQPRGHWEVDHVIQRNKGGSRGAENCLPACTECNRLRWARTGPALRRLVRLGLMATEEIERGTEIGRHLDGILKIRLSENEDRRLKKYLDGKRWELYRNRDFKGRASTTEGKLRALAAQRGGSIRVTNENNEKLVIRFRRV